MESPEQKKVSKEPPGTAPEESGATSAAPSLERMSLNADYHCPQCVMKFEDASGLASHTGTEEHALMVLATGISYSEPDLPCPIRFPPLYYCALCNVSCLSHSLFLDHFEGVAHVQMTQFMRCIAFWKKKLLVRGKGKSKEPSNALNFECLKKPSTLCCQLCNKQCNSVKTFESHTKSQRHKKLEKAVRSCGFCNICFMRPDDYESHLKSSLHARVKNFKIKMLVPKNEALGTPKRGIYVSLRAGANLLPALYFCRLCSIEFNDEESFSHHRKISIHRRIRSLINKISVKHDIAAEHEEEMENQSVLRTHYCEVCNEFCIRYYQAYDEHGKIGSHLSRRSAQVVDKWHCSPENQPIDLEPWK